MRLSRAITIATVLVLAALALRDGAKVAAVAMDADTLPRWDMAKYGAAGAHLCRSAQALDLPEVVRAVVRLDLWGPVFPVVEALAFAPFGPTYRAAGALMAVLFALCILAGFWAGRQLDEANGDLVGALVAASIATSPMFQLFGALVMLEVPGALLLLLASGAYVRSIRTGRQRDLVFACLAAAVLFFTKFNYGMAWLVPMVGVEAWLATGSLRALRARVAARLRAVPWRRPWPLFVAAYTLCLVALAVLSGRVTDPTGQTSPAVSLATPLYVLYVLVLLRAAIRPRHTWTRLRAWARDADPRHRTMALVVGLPAALWMLWPAHARGFVRVLENRSAGPPLWSQAGLAYYPRAFLEQFSTDSTAGAVVLILAALAVARLARLPRHQVPVVMALLLGVVGTLAHPYKLDRFLFPVVPLLWLTAGVGIADILRGRPRSRVAGALVGAVAGLLLCTALLTPVHRKAIAAGIAENGVAANVAPVARAAAEAAVATGRSILVGYWNDFSPGLLEWEGWRGVAGFDAANVPRPADQALGSDDPSQLPQRAARLGEANSILVLDLAPTGGAWRDAWPQETAWLDPSRRAVEADPEWRLRSEMSFPGPGYRLRVYERARGSETVAAAGRSSPGAEARAERRSP